MTVTFGADLITLLREVNKICQQLSFLTVKGLGLTLLDPQPSQKGGFQDSTLSEGIGESRF